MMNGKISILGFSGSLRKGSYNKALLRAAAELAPGEANIEIFDLEGIPPYNQDIEASMPEKVGEFKAKIKAADALIIATPEYNFSIPGVLKNALDCASRPPAENPFKGKPVAIMGASNGMIGTARAQYHLRQTLVGLNTHPLNYPEIFVTYAAQKFNEKGELTDEPTKETIKKQLDALINWTRKINAK